MADLVLTLNAGSSSLKAALFDIKDETPTALARTSIHCRDGQVAAVADVMTWVDAAAGSRTLTAAGHRVVHGGPTFHDPQLLTPEIISALEALIPLAPLHQPECLAIVRALGAARPDLPQAACFDTAFHWSQPPVAQRLGLPRHFGDQGVRRYGFHGLSYEHIAGRLAELEPALARGRVLAAHLGSGASLCAMQAGRSVETTVGFSPLDGLLMSTRCGQLDPGAILYLMQHQGLTGPQLEDLLYRRSGLLGVSGLSGDMKTLLASHETGAAEAVELFVYRAALQAGALATAMGGLDGIVFTGGIGEHSPEIRARICRRLRLFGLELDEAANNLAGDGRIATAASRVQAWVIPADEESAIAGHVRQLIRGPQGA